VSDQDNKTSGTVPSYPGGRPASWGPVSLS